MTTQQGRTALYRLLAANGRLLYVGISNNPDFRWGTHSNKQPWWHEVADRKIEWFPDRDTAAAAEVKAIAEERPLYNKQHTVRTSQLAAPVVPQHDIDPERYALGSMLLSRDVIDDIAEVVGPDDFTRSAHQTIYRVIIDLKNSGEPVSPIMVGAELTKRGHITAVGGMSYIRGLAEAVLPVFSARRSAQLVRRR